MQSGLSLKYRNRKTEMTKKRRNNTEGSSFPDPYAAAVSEKTEDFQQASRSCPCQAL